MKTIIPRSVEGQVIHCIVVDGLPREPVEVGTATARVSSITGYLTVVSDLDLGKGIRVPADWVATLEKLPRT